MLRTSGYVLAATVLALLLAGSALAVEPLFFVNDPKNLSFVSMPPVVKYLETYYAARGVTKPEDVDKFYEIIKTHGAPEAGASDSSVGLVIQDAQDASNTSGVPRGVLVIQGRFDKEKVLSMLRSHYDEHITKTAHTERASDTTLEDGSQQHTFRVPGDRPREMNIVSFQNVVLYSSAAPGDRALLEQTIAAMKAGPSAPSATAQQQSSVRYSCTFTDTDKRQLDKVIDAKYQEYKDGKLKVTAKRKGLKGWITNRVADSKINFITDSIDELDNVQFVVDRARGSDTNTKTVELTSTFETEKRAREVKRKLLRHFTDVLKGTSSNDDKLGIQSNVKITCEGNVCKVHCDLVGADEQMGAFAVISSYVARGILKN